MGYYAFSFRAQNSGRKMDRDKRRLDFNQRYSKSFVIQLFHIVATLTVDYAFKKKARLTVPDAQKRFFICRCRIRLPDRSSDFGSFRIGPGQTPFDAALRAFCTFGPQLRSKSGRARLTANFPVSGSLHYLIRFHFSYSFDIPAMREYLKNLFFQFDVHIDEHFLFLYCNIKNYLSRNFLENFVLFEFIENILKILSTIYVHYYERYIKFEHSN